MTSCQRLDEQLGSLQTVVLTVRQELSRVLAKHRKASPRSCPEFGKIRKRSLAPYLHFLVHALLHVDRAAILHPDRFEAPAVGKGVFAYLLEHGREHDFFDSTLVKACLSNALYAIWDLDALEVLVFIEYT